MSKEAKPKKRQRKLRVPELLGDKKGRVIKKIPPEQRNENNLLPTQELVAATFAKYAGQRGSRTKTAQELGCSPGYVSYLVRHNADVQQAVDEHINFRMENLRIDGERILWELGCVAFSDPAALFDENGHPLPIHEIDERARRAIAGIELEKRVYKSRDKSEPDEEEWTYTYKNALHTKVAALELWMKYKKMLDGQGNERQRDRLNEIVDALNASPHPEK